MLAWTGIFIPQAHAQYENVWAFGRNAGLDFNNGDPVPVLTAMTATNGEACASVCDANGQLLFYSEGSYVWDRNHNLMPNGGDLLPGITGESHTSSTSQGALIVPFPGDVTKYYLFSMTSMEYWGPAFGKLYYSVVDMNLNGGTGDVVAGQKGVLVDSMLLEKMTALQGDRCNIWLITGSITGPFSSVFRSYEIAASGINTTPVVSDTGLGSAISSCGIMVPSPDGSRVLATQTTGFGTGSKGMALFDFDPATGILSNQMQLLNNTAAYGATFSSDGSKVYVNETPSGIISQFDLTAGDQSSIVASRVPLGAGEFTQLKRGPDGRIYFNPYINMQTNTVGAIKFPNLAGIAADFDNQFLELVPDTKVLLGFPNIITAVQVDTVTHSSSNQAPCFASETFVQALDVTNGWDYVWNTGDVGSVLEINAAGSYWVSYHTPPCDFHVDTFHVEFPNGVLPAIHVDTACMGAANGNAYATTYPGDTVSYTYTWLNGTDTLSDTDSLFAVPAGSYTLLVRTANCDTSLNIIIPEVDYEVSFIISDTVLCMGDLLQFENTSDPHFDTFIWYWGDGDSSLSATPAGHLYVHPGSYDIMLAGTGSICRDTARFPVLIDSFFAATFQTDQPEICAGDRVRFQMPEAGPSFAGLYWDWGDGSYLAAAYDDNFVHAYAHVGVFPVRLIQYARACPDTSYTDTIRVYALPEVNLGPDTQLCVGGHTVVLRNQMEPPAVPYQYLWSTGDTTERLRVLQPGVYSLRVTTEPLGCTTTDVIAIKKDCYIDIPNAFTPNGDGDNDYFFPKGQLSQSISTFKMQLFSRWGQLVFETTAIGGRGWDGRFNNKEQPLGVYVYLIDVAYSNGRPEQYKGNVTLIR